MKGREETQKSNEISAQRYLDGRPKILQQYYSSIWNKTHHTKKQYINALSRFFDYLEENGFNTNDMNIWDNIKPLTINQYLEHLRVDENGVKRCDSYRNMQFYAIKSFFHFLEFNDLIIKNPCNRVEIIKTRQDLDVVYLTMDEVKTLKQNIINGVGNERAKARYAPWVDRDIAMVHLVLCTGLRAGAMREINMEDLDFENKRIRVVEKENFVKDIYIDDETIRVLSKWIVQREKYLLKKDKEVDALFIANTCKRISSTTFNDIIKKYSYNINKKITPHKLRSTFAMNVYGATGDIYITSNLLGHKNVETTKRYTTITEKRKHDAIDKLAKMYSEHQSDMYK